MFPKCIQVLLNVHHSFTVFSNIIILLLYTTPTLIRSSSVINGQLSSKKITPRAYMSALVSCFESVSCSGLR